MFSFKYEKISIEYVDNISFNKNWIIKLNWNNILFIKKIINNKKNLMNIDKIERDVKNIDNIFIDGL